MVVIRRDMMEATRIVLSEVERSTLERRRRRRSIAQADAARAAIVLLAADGYSNSAIAQAIGVTRKTVQSWRGRFAKERLDGLSDEPRCGAPRKIGDDRDVDAGNQARERDALEHAGYGKGERRVAVVGAAHLAGLFAAAASSRDIQALD